MNVIEVTREYGVIITLCTNHEVLECKPEQVNSAIHAADEVIHDALGQFGEDESSFRKWEGGPLSCAEKIKADWYRREVDLEALTELGAYEYTKQSEILYTSWDWIATESVPTVLQLGIETLIENAVAARDAELSSSNE